jgi:hypothetical protein
MNPRIRPLAFAALFAAIVPLSACGGGRTVVNTASQTCGKELSDLQDARAKGAMSEREYERLRKAAMARCSRRR